MARGRTCPAPGWRKALLGLGFGLATALGGCAHAPSWVPWHKSEPAPPPHSEPTPPPPPAEPPRKPKPRHVERRPQPQRQVAMVDPTALVGMKPTAVGKLLGSPSSIAKDELSLVWTYAADGCALKVYFYPDLKTTDFHVLKFSLAGADGKKLDADAPCRRKLLAVRDHDAG